MSNQDQILFERLKLGEDKPLKEIYMANSKAFKSWAIKYCIEKYGYKLSNEEATDIYHNALIIFYQKIKSGKLPILTCSIRTYLIGIGINLIKQLMDKEHKKTRLEDVSEHVHVLIDDEIVAVDSVKVNKILDEIGDECRRLLKMVFWDNLKYKEIAHTLVKTEGGARKAKFDCLKELNKVVKARGLSIDFFFSDNTMIKNEFTEKYV